MRCSLGSQRMSGILIENGSMEDMREMGELFVISLSIAVCPWKSNVPKVFQVIL